MYYNLSITKHLSLKEELFQLHTNVSSLTPHEPYTIRVARVEGFVESE